MELGLLSWMSRRQTETDRDRERETDRRTGIQADRADHGQIAGGSRADRGPDRANSNNHNNNDNTNNDNNNNDSNNKNNKSKKKTTMED